MTQTARDITQSRGVEAKMSDELKMSVEGSIHDFVRSAVQAAWQEAGIQINGVSVRWDQSRTLAGEVRASIASISLDTTSYRALGEESDDEC